MFVYFQFLFSLWQLPWPYRKHSYDIHWGAQIRANGSLACWNKNDSTLGFIVSHTIFQSEPQHVDVVHTRAGQRFGSVLNFLPQDPS